MSVPDSLKAIKPYLERGTELKSRDPIVAYHCRLYALQARTHTALRPEALLHKPAGWWVCWREPGSVGAVLVSQATTCRDSRVPAASPMARCLPRVAAASARSHAYARPPPICLLPRGSGGDAIALDVAQG
jgi:hypothetical protein